MKMLKGYVFTDKDIKDLIIERVVSEIKNVRKKDLTVCIDKIDNDIVAVVHVKQVIVDPAMPIGYKKRKCYLGEIERLFKKIPDDEIEIWKNRLKGYTLSN